MRRKDKILNYYEGLQAKNEGYISLNLNESSLDVPLWLKDRILARLKEIEWNRYPLDLNLKLLKKLADYTDHCPEGIILGNGSNELIQTIVSAFCSKESYITTIRPDFSIYKKVAEVIGVKVKEVNLREDMSFDFENIIKASKNSSVLFISIPHNPTGYFPEYLEILKVLESVDCLVVLDEAYAEFSGETFVPLLSRYKNLLILRTFSKAFRMAGARLGYLLGSPEIVQVLKQVKLPFSVGIFQQICAEIIMEERDSLLLGLKEIILERERLFNKIQNLKFFHPFPSRANFLLVESSFLSAEEVFQLLKKRKILVRIFEIPELRNRFRITVGKREENDYFLENLFQIEEEVLNAKKG
ncbi:MAG: histidinol-phosphate transaminase [Candidatus Aminicenantia bacterium]